MAKNNLPKTKLSKTADHNFDKPWRVNIHLGTRRQRSPIREV